MAPPDRPGWPSATSKPDTPAARRRCARTPPPPRVRRLRGRDARRPARWRHTRSRAQHPRGSPRATRRAYPRGRPADRRADPATRAEEPPKHLLLCAVRVFVWFPNESGPTASRRARAAPPSLTDTTWTSTPDATSCAVVAPRPRVSSSGWGATTTRPGHPVRSSGGRGPLLRAASHTGTGVPPRVSGLAANRAQLPVRHGPQGVLNTAAPRAARARPDPARRGFVVYRWSGRRPAERAGRPDIAGPAPGRGRCG